MAGGKSVATCGRCQVLNDVAVGAQPSTKSRTYKHLIGAYPRNTGAWHEAWL